MMSADTFIKIRVILLICFSICCKNNQANHTVEGEIFLEKTSFYNKSNKFREINNIKPRVLYKNGDSLRKKYPVVFQHLNDLFEKENINNDKRPINFSLNPKLLKDYPESYYKIVPTKNVINILAGTEEGLLNAVVKLQHEIRETHRLPTNNIEDWSVLQTRALHFALRGGESLEQMKALVDIVRTYNYNTFIILLVDSVELKSLKQSSDKKRWTKDDFKILIQYAKESGLEVIPEVKLLTHQEKLLGDQYPELMFNKTTYNPNNAQVYPLIYSVIDEVLNITKSNYFHIGHDEVAGIKNKIKTTRFYKKGDEVLKNEAFINHVVKIQNYLAKKDVQTMMWGDMLVSKKEFPQMSARNLNGEKGYSGIRKRIPKDIIICDWHYFDQDKNFSTYNTFYKNGNPVLGATWKKMNTTRDFTNYVKQSNNLKKGMIATTWYGFKKNEILLEIISESGKLFWDAK